MQTINTPEELDALLSQAGQDAEPLVVREGFRVWILTEDEGGQWWAWSWREEGESANPVHAEALTLPLTVLYRPDAPTPDYAGLVAEVRRSGCAVELGDIRIHPCDTHGRDLTNAPTAPAEDREALDPKTREKVAARIWRGVFEPAPGAMWSQRGVVPESLAARCRAAAERLHRDGMLAARQPAPVDAETLEAQTQWRVESETTEDEFGTDEAAARQWLSECQSRPDWEPSVLMSRTVTTITTPWKEVRHDG